MSILSGKYLTFLFVQIWDLLLWWYPASWELYKLMSWDRQRTLRQCNAVLLSLILTALRGLRGPTGGQWIWSWRWRWGWGWGCPSSCCLLYFCSSDGGVVVVILGIRVVVIVVVVVQDGLMIWYISVLRSLGISLGKIRPVVTPLQFLDHQVERWWGWWVAPSPAQ